MGENSGYRYVYCEYCGKMSKFGLPEARVRSFEIESSSRMHVEIETRAKCLECEMGALVGFSEFELVTDHYPTADTESCGLVTEEMYGYGE